MLWVTDYLRLILLSVVWFGDDVRFDDDDGGTPKLEVDKTVVSAVVDVVVVVVAAVVVDVDKLGVNVDVGIVVVFVFVVLLS